MPIIIKAEKLDRIDGIMAYDSGCASSGISDPVFKESLKFDPELDEYLLALIRQYMEQGQYAYEDIDHITQWARDELDWES